MLIDIKKIFTKGTTLGRFEYLKIVYGLLIFPMLFLQLAIIIPPNNILVYPAIFIALVVLAFYITIDIIAMYKRINNIFNKPAISIILVILSNFVIIFGAIFRILLFIIPGKKKSDINNIVSGKLFWITFPMLILLIISLNIIGINRYVPSKAMTDTIQPFDRIIINIFDKNYQRGDIIIHKSNKKTVFLKRIIALPGEKVEIKTLENGAKHIFINDKLLNEPYVKDIYNYPECSSEMKCEAIIVPKNSYYVLGDNRGNSYDSRYYGPVHSDLIKGKASHIWFPLNRRQVFEPIKYSFSDNKQH